ncbi:MAG: hypothetical protein WDW38_009769 [Sanguina aurantia]
MIKELLATVDGNGATALHVAIMSGRVGCAAVLLQSGASATRGCDGNPPLHMAVNLGLHAGREADAHALVGLLLKHGADPLSRDYWGRTALHWTGVAGLAETFSTLLRAADASMQRSAAATIPSSGGSSASGLDPAGTEGTSILEAQDHDGNTALHLAVRFGSTAIALLACSAQPFMAQAAVARLPATAAATATSSADPTQDPTAVAVEVDTVMGESNGPSAEQASSAPQVTAAAPGERTAAAAAAAAAGAGGSSDDVTMPGVGESGQQRAARGLLLQAQLHARLCKSRNKEGLTPLHVAGVFGREAEAAVMAGAVPECVGLMDRRRRSAAGLAGLRGHAALCLALSPPTGHATSQHGASVASSAPTLAELSTTPTAAAAAAAAAVVQTAVAIIAPPECLLHRTAPEPITRSGEAPPPENINRLHVLTKEGSGILLTKEFSHNAAVHWDSATVPAAPMADVLAVHDWAYIKGIQEACARIPDNATALGHLDGDTAIGRHSLSAALKAAGAVISGVDAVLQGKASAVFCAVRPPGHHAGPQGACVNANDPNGSHGFCLLSNIAIGAAYAMNVYRHAGIRRVAILDFDVHHGNGTQAVVMNTVPSTQRVAFSTPFAAGGMEFPTYKPWLGVEDASNIFFASVQGYGRRTPNSSSWFYPGSGATADSIPAPPHTTSASSATGNQPPLPSSVDTHTHQLVSAAATASSDPAASTTPPSNLLPEDPDGEFEGSFDTLISGGPVMVPNSESPPFLAVQAMLLPARQGIAPTGPRVINVGIGGPGVKSKAWRRAWRDKILPALVNFRPDMLFVSAGFDAHKKEDLNLRYIGVTETDYEWLTGQLVDVAARCCNGRLVSVLEGGYNLRGGVSSVFARSTAAHVRALAAGPPSGPGGYDPSEAESERKAERKKAEKAAAAAASHGLRLSEMLGPSLAAAAAALFGPNSKTAAAVPVLTATPPTLATAASPAPAPLTSQTCTATEAAVAVEPAAAAAATVAVVTAAAGSAGAAGAAAAAEEGPNGKRRRRAGTVDYAALNASLEASDVVHK